MLNHRDSLITLLKAGALLAVATCLFAQPPAPQGAAPAQPGPGRGAPPAVDASPLGTIPAEGVTPKLEFAFEEAVTLGRSVNMGDTPFGGRNFITITGGTVAGPKFKGKVMPGGWDYQLHGPNGCGTISADYFLQADDGTIINVVNKALTCPGGPGRLFTRPVFEAPKGQYEWMNSAVFVGTLEMGAGGIRIRFYQVK
jgi:hypothetical protein